MSKLESFLEKLSVDIDLNDPVSCHAVVKDIFRDVCKGYTVVVRLDGKLMKIYKTETEVRFERVTDEIV